MRWIALRKVGLRSLILIFSLLVMLLTLLNCFYSAWHVQQNVLVSNELAKNRAYAERVASSISLYFRVSMDQLAYSANILENKFDNPKAITNELERIQQQDSGFDSVTLVDASGRVIGTYPENISINGKIIDTEGVQQSLHNVSPTISNAYNSASGSLIVYISYPIFDPQGKYLGFVGGAIHLQRDNILSSLIGSHYHSDKSYVYLVDQDDVLLYHPEKRRIGTTEKDNDAVEAVERGETGALEVVNSEGTRMLAGYASVPLANWGVVSQQPKETTLASLNTLMYKMVIGTLPLSIPVFFLLWWLSNMISAPLRRLAASAGHMDNDQADLEIRNIHAWYVEAIYIKQGLLNGIDLVREKIKWLSDQASRDHLTRLLNRRAAQAVLDDFNKKKKLFSIASIDIDHFKHVNDSFGHDAGDFVLQWLATIMQENCREGDYACRMGGEEFYLLLPDITTKKAIDVVERLRKKVESTTIDGIGNITISSGITSWPQGDLSIQEILKKADELMYLAKRNGRNRTEWQ
ncbi:GGDEF domain-containing protein [Shimwellia pseudoproteus]|uniref:sensor domain-containing diguanylate cyclase n=1 Tax=Shimwellia pseudoproteus TaxID=570012 RepID=UPI0018EC36ED|nr:sensor domain-containing diguanylate cyclase [Shimwellia pseudoproteus]MBJ3814924.1 GGDEF domain-containing protein [Shimwellia pseudoproteus]